MAAKRLARELKDLTSVPPHDISAGPADEDLFHWIGIFSGPKNTGYEGGFFILDICIPPDYPFKPPKFKFTTEIYHANIKPSGVFCACCVREGVLSDNWSPALTIAKGIREIRQLLIYPEKETLDLSHPASLAYNRATNDQYYWQTKVSEFFLLYAGHKGGKADSATVDLHSIPLELLVRITRYSVQNDPHITQNLATALVEYHKSASEFTRKYAM